MKDTLAAWARKGVARIRLAVWANPADYFRLDLFADGTYGPWLHLYAPVQKMLGYPSPQDTLVTTVDANAPEWEQYTGPRHEEDTQP